MNTKHNIVEQMLQVSKSGHLVNPLQPLMGSINVTVDQDVTIFTYPQLQGYRNLLGNCKNIGLHLLDWLYTSPVSSENLFNLICPAKSIISVKTEYIISLTGV